MTNRITDEIIENLEILAKLELSESEKEQAKLDMERMLAYIDKLGELDTENVEPTTHILPLQNVLREDVTTNSDTREELLANAPEEKAGMILVPRAFE